MDCTVHGILQARILKWVAFPFSRGSSQPRDQTQVFHIAGKFFISWATRESSRMNRYTDVDQPACQRRQVSLSVWLPDVDHTQKGTSLNLARAPLKAKSKWGRPSAKQEPRAGREKLSSVQSLSYVQLFTTQWTAACQASLYITSSQNLLKLMSIESVMPSNHLILCHPFSSFLQSFAASGSFLMNQLFASSNQRTGASASASVLPMNIQEWFPVELTGVRETNWRKCSFPIMKVGKQIRKT